MQVNFRLDEIRATDLLVTRETKSASSSVESPGDFCVLVLVGEVYKNRGFWFPKPRLLARWQGRESHTRVQCSNCSITAMRIILFSEVRDSRCGARHGTCSWRRSFNIGLSASGAWQFAGRLAFGWQCVVFRPRRGVSRLGLRPGVEIGLAEATFGNWQVPAHGLLRDREAVPGQSMPARCVDPPPGPGPNASWLALPGRILHTTWRLQFWDRPLLGFLPTSYVKARQPVVGGWFR